MIKPSAADARLLQHTGPAVVFKNYDDMEARLDREDLAVDENSVLVLQNAGPLGGPGMPEWGMLPIPKKLLQRGVRDMVRISDARMSGTSYGTCVLHVSPESFVGGPLALVRDGDQIRARRSKSKTEFVQYRTRSSAEARARTGYRPRLIMSVDMARSILKRVTQADKGCDFDFLQDRIPSPEPEIH